MSTQQNRNEFVESFAKGLAILQALSSESASLAEVARKTGQSRATARRFLLTLSHLGYCSSDQNGYRLTAKVLELGALYQTGAALSEIATPHMRSLVSKLGEASALGTLNGDKVIIVAYARPSRRLLLQLDVGDTLPASRSAQGRILLAQLPHDEARRHIDSFSTTTQEKQMLLHSVRMTRELGYAIVDGEIDEGIRSIAIQLNSSSQKPNYAITVCAHANRVSAEELLASYLPELRSCAQAIQKEWPTHANAISEK